MVKKRQGEGLIPEIPFAAPVGAAPGVEMLSLAQLRDRAAGSDILSTPQRPTFHHLLTVDSGLLWHTVDFTGYALEPGSWLWIRPGQVQQWQDLRRAEGTLILFEPDFLDPATTDAADLNNPYAPVLHTTTGEQHQALDLATKHLRHELEHGLRTAAAIYVVVLRHLLAALVLRLTTPATTRAAELRSSPGSSSTSRTSWRRTSPAVDASRTTPTASATRPAPSRGRPSLPPASTRKNSSIGAPSWKPNACWPTATAPRPRSPLSSASPMPPTSASTSSSGRA